MKIADAEGIRLASQKVVSRMAEEGNAVIVGRGSAQAETASVRSSAQTARR